MHQWLKIIVAAPLVVMAVAGAGVPDRRIVARWRHESGKRYSLVRKDLIKAGALPINQRPLFPNCLAPEAACSAYPEVLGCFADISECQFEWRSNHGRPFTVLTNDDPRTLLVQVIIYQ